MINKFINTNLTKVLVVLLLSLPFHHLRAGAKQDSVNTITIKAIGGLQYDLPRFRVNPGSRVRIVFINDDDMSHNLVITAPGAREQVVNAALKLGANGIKMNYIPTLSKVLWSIKLLLPGESRSITFKVPTKTGVYPYVCTYPGHGFIMYGAMYVSSQILPPIKDDLNISARSKTLAADSAGLHQTQHMHVPNHPYKLIPPFLYRSFMPDAGPAAIAVSLPDSLSYCWDAGNCRLRYAWQGGFIDNKAVWKGHKDALARVIGKIFYRDKTLFPLHLENPASNPTAKFLGYRLVTRYPEFHYKIDSAEVFELIQSKADGSGLTRRFRILQNSQVIWFTFLAGDGVAYSSDAGEWKDGKLKLSATQAREFTITMTKEKP